MPSTFPLEIEEMILDILDEDDEGHSALKTCSFVCQAFLHICRKHLFKNIVLNTISSPTTRAFERLLRKTPEIADYIRKLDFTIQAADLANLTFQESWKRISRLEFLRVQPCTMLDWSNNPIRPVLLHLLHLPTLTHFKVHYFNDFVVSDLIPCVNLKYLDINFTTVAAENTFPATLPEHLIHLNEFVYVAHIETSTVIMNLCTARRPDGLPIIDFGFLSKITVDIKEPIEREASQELFRHCHVLTNVHITLRNPFDVRPNLADMLRPSMQTLKHIVVDIIIDDVDVDVGVHPLFGIPSELEDMCNKNIIETIEISVADVIGCRGDEGQFDWGHGRLGSLDEVLTALGWFSLKRVSLTMGIYRHFRSDKLDVALRKLLMRQFPRLSSSKSVSFDFKVNDVHE